MNSSIFKQFLFAAFLHMFLAASVFGQKYENGTRLLKGAEVLSATPLQLDYVLETLADTANITVNLHEGKTHLVLNDGSGKWREWWYYMGKWRIKTGDETDPTVPAHIKSITDENMSDWFYAYDNSHKHSNKSAIDGISAGHVTNWNAAYDWGNHATQGYLKNYTLPVATTSVLGGVKAGSRVTIAADGTINANPQDWTNITGKPTYAIVATSGSYNDLTNLPTIPAAFTLPAATTTTLGGVKIGNGLSVTADGTLTNTATDGIVTETDPTVPAHIKSITATNIANWNTALGWGDHATQGYLKSYALPVATPSVLGGVKAGSRITIAADGTISANQQTWTDITGKPTYATVATSGNYNDLTNKPTIPAAQVNADWNATSGLSQILNKPNIPTAYNLPAATATTLGGVKVGSGLSVTSDGTLSSSSIEFETGTWSPSTTGGTFSSSFWFRIGNIVHVSTILVMTSTSGGLININGLPKVVKTNTSWIASVNTTGSGGALPHVAASVFQSGGSTILCVTNHSYITTGAYYLAATYLTN